MDSNETEKWKNKKNQGNGIVSLKKINKIGRLLAKPNKRKEDPD